MTARIRRSLLESPGCRLLDDNGVQLPSASICIILKNDKASSEPVVLMVKRRAIQSDPWSGDMAFPGGRRRKDDRDSYETVAREVSEETGIDLRNCTMLGTLDDVKPNSIQMRVTPFVAIATENTDVNLDGYEIVEYVWLPVQFFLNGSNLSTHTIERFGKKIEVTSLKYLEKYVIWGMSLRILNDLASRLR